MTHVRRHTRITARGRKVTVRTHERDDDAGSGGGSQYAPAAAPDPGWTPCHAEPVWGDETPSWDGIYEHEDVASTSTEPDLVDQAWDATAFVKHDQIPPGGPMEAQYRRFRAEYAAHTDESARRQQAASASYPCGNCGGSGVSRLAPTATCNRCGGSGKDPYAMR